MPPAALDLRNAPTRAADKPGASRLGFSALTGTKRRGAAAVAAHIMGVGPITSSSSRSGSEALVEIESIVKNVFRVTKSEVSQHDELVWRSGQDA